MKNSELRGLTVDELTNKLVVEKESYDKLKFAHSLTPIENPMKIRSSRRLISRIETILKEKNLSTESNN